MRKAGLIGLTLMLTGCAGFSGFYQKVVHAEDNCYFVTERYSGSHGIDVRTREICPDWIFGGTREEITGRYFPHK